MNKNRKYAFISRTTIRHQSELLINILFFVIAAAFYAYTTFFNDELNFLDSVFVKIFLVIVWIYFMAMVITKMIPNEIESMGCQKVFASNYHPLEYSQNDIEEKKKIDNRGALIVGAIWVTVNLIIYTLHHFGILDDGAVILISMFFTVCDIICILYFCPFQQLIMKHRCCVRCRMYNWDKIMQFLPLLCIRHFLSYSLVAVSLYVFIKWEYTYKKHPEYFAVFSNASLKCTSCTEKLCLHKRALKRFIEDQTHFITEEYDKINSVIKKMW